MSAFLQDAQTLDDDELIKLGTKDPETEVEKFVQANTQEIGKEQWLCPLSGKRFKSPEYTRKHIFNKHMEKVGIKFYFNQICQCYAIMFIYID